MKYDLIVVGGGPGGLMAAKIAAEDGLKVVLIERKKNITEINRACSQIFYLRKHTASSGLESDTGLMHIDGYIEPISVESYDQKTLFHLQSPGFSIDYTGCLRPYLNWIYISPSGYKINGFEWNSQPWGFYYHKETFLAGILALVEMAGVEVLLESVGLGIENTSGGIKVQVRGKSGEQTIEGRAAIVADGVNSKLVEGLGLNEKRQILSTVRRKRGVGLVQYVLEGVETGFPEASWLTWTIPSMQPYGNIFMGLSVDNRHTLTAPAPALVEFMNDPRYAPMFHRARVVKKEGFTLSHVLSPLREPVAGNVVIIGDAAAPVETWIQGALACGYKAVKAIKKELDGKKGYSEYTNWWQRAFAFNTPEYAKVLGIIYLLNRVCSDEEIDYIYKLFQGNIGIPVMLVYRNLELIKKGRPELYEKLTQAIG
jgi:flavin-dependent dehydrogenase